MGEIGDEWVYLVGVNTKNIASDDPGGYELDFFLEIPREDMDEYNIEKLLRSLVEGKEKERVSVNYRRLNGDLVAIQLRMRYQSNLVACLFRAPARMTREMMTGYLKYAKLKDIQKAIVHL